MNGNNLFVKSLIDDYKLYGINFFSEYRLKILAEAQQIYPKNELRQLLYLDQHTYLQSLNDRNDRATMGASIECREPFMDYRLMEGLGSLPNELLFKGKKNKYILNTTIGEKLPDYIRNFKKVGFNVPWTDYFIADKGLRDVLHNLPNCELFKIGVFGRLDVTKCRDEFIKYGKHKGLITQLMFSSIWYGTYFARINKK
jgi:asparagine synthase (glutamine-hydrolysing)